MRPLELAQRGDRAAWVSSARGDRRHDELGAAEVCGGVSLVDRRAAGLGIVRLRGEGRQDGQEQGKRSGTENVAGISAFGAACATVLAGLAEEGARLTQLRNQLIDGLRRIDPALVVFGEEADRLPNTLYFAPSFIQAQTALMRFDLAGVSLSSGSACSSGKVKESHVLVAMGVDPDLRKRALRLSLGWSSTQDDVTRFCDLYEKEYQIKSGARAA